MSFGEAASVITINGSTAYFFKLFYTNFPEVVLDWFVYLDIPEFEFYYLLDSKPFYSDVEELKILSHLVRPSLLLVEVRHGREKPPTSYEFYCPSIVTRQRGFGQLPPGLFFADKLKPRETVTNSIEFNNILQFEQTALLEAINGWKGIPFTSLAFDHWWQEWSQHILSEATSIYCFSLDSDFQADLKV
jgi:hypothetical protein